MGTRTIPLSEFRLDDFLAAYTAFHRRWSGTDDLGSAAVYLVDKLGDTPMPSDEERDLAASLVENGRLVFFPFHEPITGDEVKCLDGSVVVDDADDPQLDIGVADSYGYLVEVRDRQITIRRALYDGSSGPVPTVEVVDGGGVFDERMGVYLERFVRPA